MKLGKRYIAIVNSNGKDVAININYEHDHQAGLAHVRNIDPRAGHVATLVIDLDFAMRTTPPLTDEESAMYWERVELHAAEQRQRYWHAVTPSEERGDRRTTQPEHAVFDVEYHAWPIVPRGGQHVGVSTGVIVIHRPTGVAVIRDDERSQMRNREAAIAELRRLVQAPVSPGTLTPAEWSALEKFSQAIERELGRGYTDSTRPLLVSAISKLREQAGRR